MQKFTVSGYVEPNKVLKKMSKVLKKVKGTGKRAELWPYVRYNLVTQPFSPQTCDKESPAGFVRKDNFNTATNSDSPTLDKKLVLESMGRSIGALEYFSDLFGGTRIKRKKRRQLQVRKIKRAVSSMSGVKTVDINRKMQKVTVSGYVEPNKVLKTVKGTGKRAELWPYVPYNSVTQPFSPHTYDKKAPAGFVRKENFNTASNSNGQDDFVTMFSEENPNSCCIR